jgi:hypothetical protein
MKTEFQTLLVSELKSVFDSWKRKRNEKNFCFSGFCSLASGKRFLVPTKRKKTTAKPEKSVENPNF